MKLFILALAVLLVLGFQHQTITYNHKSDDLEGLFIAFKQDKVEIAFEEQKAI